MIWTVLEVTAILAESYIITMLFVQYFGFAKTEYARIKHLLYFLWFVMIDCVGTFVVKQELFFVLSFVMSSFVFALICLKGNLFEKFFIALLSYIMIYFSNLPILFIGAHFSERSVDAFVYDTQNAVRVLSLGISKIIYFALCQGILMIHRKSRYRFKTAEWIIITTGFAITLLIAFSVLMIAYQTAWGNYFMIAIAILLCILDAIIFVFIRKLNVANQKETEHKMKIFQIQQQEQDIRRLDKQYQEIAIFRHDIRNQMRCVHDLIAQKEYEKAQSYIETMLDRNSTSAPLQIHCSSSVVNAVINAQFQKASEYEIICSARIVTEVLPESEYDLSIILSNLLDNAREACQKQTGVRKMILSVSELGAYYRIIVKNTIAESVLRKNHRLMTAKSDRGRHGWGLKSVREIASSYNGTMDIFEEEDMFVVSILMMKNKKL
ncbi:MAG: GHKL domain-containing protein [Oscillospiraceae bacterium]|nr:GHKL domain-containing protein [Oscillospiraceae bacterium]